MRRITLWLNHVTIAAAANGTNSHDVDPANTGTVVDGTAFNPTTGRLLVCYVEGAVTSTTPTGWTLPTNGSAINNTGLYVWWREAAGGDTFSTTHNGSNFPVLFDFYEFESNSVFLSSATATGVSNGGAGPTLSGLTGTNHLSAVMGQAMGVGGATSVAWSAGTEEVDTNVNGTITGYTYSLAYLEDSAASSWSSAATVTGGPGDTLERLVTAVIIGTAGDILGISPQVFVP